LSTTSNVSSSWTMRSPSGNRAARGGATVDGPSVTLAPPATSERASRATVPLTRTRPEASHCFMLRPEAWGNCSRKRSAKVPTLTRSAIR